MIYNTSAPVFKVYYGSTVQTLNDRMSVHKSSKNCESKSIIASGTYAYPLLEDYPCNTKKELQYREAEYIISNWDSCLNKTIPGAIDRAGGILQYDRLRNKTAKRKEYKKKHNKEYRKKNAEKIAAQSKEYKKQKVTCNLCGSMRTKNSIARHKKTKTCRAFVQSEVKNVLDDMLNQLC